MAFNLLQTVTDHLDDGLLGQISGLSGINKNQASSALGSMLPALIGGLMKQGSTNEGAGALLDLITKGGHTGGLLDNLGDILGGDKSKGLMDTGNSLLSTIFGGNLGSIMNILGKVTGLTRGSSGSLMSLLAPIAINFIGKRVKNKALDAVGLKNLLGEQRQHVSAGMPAEIGKMLGFASSKTDNVAAATTSSRTEASAPKGGGGGFLKFLIPLLLLGGLAWMFLGKGGDKETKTTTTTEQSTTKATGNKATKKTTTTNTHTHADGTVHSGDHSHGSTTKVGEAANDAAGAVKEFATAAGDAIPEGKVEAKLMVNPVGDLVDEQGKVIFKKGEFTIAEDGTFLDKDGKRIRIFLYKVKDAIKGAGQKIKNAGSKVKDKVKGN